MKGIFEEMVIMWKLMDKRTVIYAPMATFFGGVLVLAAIGIAWTSPWFFGLAAAAGGAHLYLKKVSK